MENTGLIHFDDLLGLLGELENEGESEEETADTDSLRWALEVETAELRFIRVMMERVSIWSSRSIHDFSWVSAIETLVKNAFIAIQQPYETRDIAQMAAIVFNLFTSIAVHKKSIISFCKFYIKKGRHDLLASGGLCIRDPVADILDPMLTNLDFMLDNGGPLLENMDSLRIYLMWRPLEEKVQVLLERLIFIRHSLELRIMCEGLFPGKYSKFVLNFVVLISEHALFVWYLCAWEIMGDHLEVLLNDILVEILDTEPYIRLQYSCDLRDCEIQREGEIEFQALGALEALDFNLKGWISTAAERDTLRTEMDHITALLRVVPLMKYFLMESTEVEFCTELAQITFWADEVSCVLLSLSLSEETQDGIFDKLNAMLYDLLKCIEITMSKIKQDFMPENITWHVPGPLHLGSVDFFLQNLDDLVCNRGILIHAYAKDDIGTVQSELLMLRSLVGDTMGRQKNFEVKGLEQIKQQLVAVSYMAEFLVDYIVCANGAKWRHMLLLSDVVNEIKLLNSEASKICGITMHMKDNASEITNELGPDKLGDEEDVVGSESLDSSFAARPSRIYYADDEEMVGFEDELEKIRDRLERGPKHLDVVSIVGMPGLGKTTLARKLYKIRSVTSYFHLRSWCCVSQVYTRIGLLLDILDDIIEPGTGRNFGKMSADDLADVLYKSLKGRKYLIVLDDIWSVDAWRDLSLCFPNEGNGSRILLTCQSEQVCLQIKPNGSPVNLRLFSNEESWLLLQKKVFGGSIAPLKQSTAGRKIAECCEGLPLAVVLVSGFLDPMVQWGGIEESMSKQNFDEENRIMGVLGLSYLHLPDHLKPCFLYFGIFPADKEISVQKLIALWIAEGMVPTIKGRNLEDVAEAYLKDLVGRSLVMVTSGKSKGGIKTCRIHGLLLQFCLEMANEQNFLLLSQGNEDIFSFWNFPEDEDYYLPRDHHPERFSFHADPYDMEFWRPYAFPHARSLLFFSPSPVDYIAELPSDFSFLKHRAKLLRVFELAQSKICKGFPHGVEFLSHLRYLAVRVASGTVPPEIMNLWSLETLLVKGVRGEVSVPGNIWKLRKLRNLQIHDRADFKSVEDGVGYGYGDLFDNSFASFDIESLATPTLRFGDDSILGTLAQLQCLRKLKCIFMESWDVSRNCNRFPALDFLSVLESLKVIYHGKVQHPCGEFSFPLNLRKLTLSKFRLPWSHISEIGRLPNLEVLKLLFKSFEGNTWEVNDEEFMNLKFLELEALDIAQWDVSMCSDPFPCLEHLVVQRCKKLESIPSELGYVTTLQKIEVQFCSRAAAESAEAIQEEQLDMGNCDLQVHIHPSGAGFGPIPEV